MEENKESKAKRMLVVGFLLIIVLASSIVLVSLYKKEAGRVTSGSVVKTK